MAKVLTISSILFVKISSIGFCLLIVFAKYNKDSPVISFSPSFRKFGVQTPLLPFNAAKSYFATDRFHEFNNS